MATETFLQHNPWSKLQAQEHGQRIELPWNDSTLTLELSALGPEAIGRLNDLILFPSFSAIYHRAETKMEVIYTPFRQTELEKRHFNFEFEGNRYECSFAPPSQAVLDLALASTPVAAPTSTDYRNLRHFRRYIAISETDRKGPAFAETYSPVSFWIEPCFPDEQQLIRLFEHINFFMAYFDQNSPSILIHEAEPSDALKEKRVRYLWDEFPDSIRATTVDPYLLGLWSSARGASDTFRQFIY